MLLQLSEQRWQMIPEQKREELTARKLWVSHPTSTYPAKAEAITFVASMASYAMLLMEEEIVQT